MADILHKIHLFIDVTFMLHLETYRLQYELFNSHRNLRNSYLEAVVIALDSKSNTGSKRIEILMRLSRLRLGMVLLAIVSLWVTVVAMVFWPTTYLAQWPTRFPLLFPILVLIEEMVLRLTGDHWRWQPDSPEAKLIVNDEFRRANLMRAQRLTLMVVLVSQVPLGFLHMHLPSMRAVLGMAGTTIGLGMSTVIVLFLFFDRE